MKILMVHNYYQLQGGEDLVFSRESDLLRSGGHTVFCLSASNNEIVGLRQKIDVALGAIWSRDGFKKTLEAIDRFRPDIVHVHNYFPLLSPSVFYACKKRGVPVVHTIHNYRPLCANAMMMRDGKQCSLCVGRSSIPAIVYKCYRGSRFGSATLGAMIDVNRMVGTWKGCVDRFVVLTNFAKEIFQAAGYPESRLTVKPNFSPRPPKLSGGRNLKKLLFVGRLSDEKGVHILLEASRGGNFEVDVVGGGPAEGRLRELAPANVSFKGKLTAQEVAAAMQNAAALVVPSTWVEGFPLVLTEAMANGLPVIGSQIGGIAEVVQHAETGLLFEPGSAYDLRQAIDLMLSDRDMMERMSILTKRVYEEKYSPEAALRDLEMIYSELIQEHEVSEAGSIGA